MIIKFSFPFISMSKNVSVTLFTTGIWYESHFKQDLIYGIEKNCLSHLIVGKQKWCREWWCCFEGPKDLTDWKINLHFTTALLRNYAAFQSCLFSLSVGEESMPGGHIVPVMKCSYNLSSQGEPQWMVGFFQGHSPKGEILIMKLYFVGWAWWICPQGL